MPSLISIDSLRVVAAERDRDLEFAADFAADEIERLSGVRPPRVDPLEVSDEHFAVFFQLRSSEEDGFDESYRLSSSEGFVKITASSKCGLLFAVGRLLRLCSFRAGELEITIGLDLEFRPKSRIRSHQIGYGHLSNSMDSWAVAQFDRYIRDLVLFGCNAIEIEYKPDDSPHHILPFEAMMAEISAITARYGLDCTIWVPNWEDEAHYLDPERSDRELRDLGRFLATLPNLSAITVPGGDPGSLRPRVLFPWVERLTDLLVSCGHPPRAWVSAQWMKADDPWYDEFFECANENPPWLSGIVHGPWTQLSIPELRRRLRENIPIRRYTDLTHGIYCQYPIQDWDLAHAMTSGREPINPRPTAYKHIHNLYCGYTIGSTPHTTGVNADINVFVWLDQEWDPETEVCETLREYAQVFIDSSLEADFPKAVLALERNWEGPLLTNDGVEETLDRWRQLELSAGTDAARNWRFQSLNLRAHYDACIRRRLIRETEVERRVFERLSADRSIDAIQSTLAQLNKAATDPDALSLRQRCFELSEALNHTIGLKSSVDRHGAAQKGRGAFMDAIDEPLNDSKWLIDQLEKAAAERSDVARSDLVQLVLSRIDPGGGGIYDNLGNPNQVGKFANPVDFGADPGGLAGSRLGFGIAIDGMPRSQTVEIKEHEGQPIPLAWLTCAEAIYHTPLTLIYEGLDDSKAYELRIVYPSRIGRKAKLVANDAYVVHECIATGDEPCKSFRIPAGVVSNGRLELKWTGEGERGIQVAELFLTPK